MNKAQREIADGLLKSIASAKKGERLDLIREYAEFVMACRTHAEALSKGAFST